MWDIWHLWLQPGPALATAAIWEINCRQELSVLLSRTPSFKQTKRRRIFKQTHTGVTLHLHELGVPPAPAPMFSHRRAPGTQTPGVTEGSLPRPGNRRLWPARSCKKASRVLRANLARATLSGQRCGSAHVQGGTQLWPAQERLLPSLAISA